MAHQSNRSRDDYTVGWICALSTEAAAAMAMLDEEHEDLPQPPNDNNAYSYGRIGKHNVVIAYLPSATTGTAIAASVASRLRVSFSGIRIGLMVGIGGGVPNDEHDVRLGDVVVSQPTDTLGGVLQYDMGKTGANGEFIRTGQLNRPPLVLLGAVSKVKTQHELGRRRMDQFRSEAIVQNPALIQNWSHPGARHDQLFQAQYDHASSQDKTCANCDRDRTVPRQARNQETPVIHYGLIASGNQVMRYGRRRDDLGKQHGVICFEMEAAGLMNDFPCLVVRGICDYADTHKNKQWQSYAAGVAAAYAKELLYLIAANEVMQTARITIVQGRNDPLRGYNEYSTEKPPTANPYKGSPSINEMENNWKYRRTLRKYRPQLLHGMVIPLQDLKKTPAPVKCPVCDASVISQAATVRTGKQWFNIVWASAVSAGLLAYPVASSNRNFKHTCPVCDYHLATSKSMMNGGWHETIVPRAYK